MEAKQMTSKESDNVKKRMYRQKNGQTEKRKKVCTMPQKLFLVFDDDI